MGLLLRNISLAIIAAAVLISTSGILLHKHYCSREGLETTSLISVPTQDDHATSCDPSCCSIPGDHPQAEAPAADPSCCSDSFLFFKLPTFFSSLIIKIIPQVVFCDVPPAEQSEPEADNVPGFLNFNDYQPPPLIAAGKTFLSFIQQFRFHLL